MISQRSILVGDNIVLLGSAALDLCKVADGSFDAFVDMGEGLALWDYAGAALNKEAGAKITDSESNPISYYLALGGNN